MPIGLFFHLNGPYISETKCLERLTGALLLPGVTDCMWKGLSKRHDMFREAVVLFAIRCTLAEAQTMNEIRCQARCLFMAIKGEENRRRSENNEYISEDSPSCDPDETM